FARWTPCKPMFDPAERMLRRPFCLDLVAREPRILGAVGRFDIAAVGVIDAITASSGLGVDEGCILACGRVSVVAKDIHRLMIAEDDDDPAALAWRFLLQLLEIADDFERVRPAIGDVAHLD